MWGRSPPPTLLPTDSVTYYQMRIQQREDVPPIWVVQQDNQYTLLDGAHRIVASYIEGNLHINAYVIRL